MAKTSKTNKSHYDQALDILGITGRLAQMFQSVNNRASCHEHVLYPTLILTTELIE